MSLLNWAVEKPRRRGYGLKARISTVMNDDIYALTKYILNETHEWKTINTLEPTRFYLDPWRSIPM